MAADLTASPATVRPQAPAADAEPTTNEGLPQRSRVSSPIAVTMIGTLPPWRGVAPYTHLLLQALESVGGLEIEFIDFTSLYPPRLYPGGDPVDRGAARPMFRRASVRRLLAWYNPLSWLWAGLTLRGSVVHAQWWSYVLAPVYLFVLALARLRGKRVLLTLHNVSPHDASGWRRWLYRSVFHLAHHFIVHAQRNADVLATVHPRAAGRITVVPLGLHSVAAREDLTREEARQRLALPSDRPVILAFGNIRPYKGLDVLLPAFRLVLDAGVEAALAIVGQPWEDFRRYERIIGRLELGPHVHTRLGYAPDEEVEAFFSAADVAVLPYTDFDAQSGAGTLALSFGLPLIVSDVGGLPELVDDSRAVVPPNSPAALAEAIRAVLTDEAFRARLAAGSRRRASELDWRQIARRTTDVYRLLAAP